MNSKKRYRYYDLLLGAFVAVLLCANLIGASKVTQISFWIPWIGAQEFRFGAGTLFFPLSYLFNDLLTEVYGYSASRRVVWAGFGAMVFATFMAWVVVQLPPAAGWAHQAALETVFTSTPRIVAGSLLAFFLGEFLNSYTLAKMKVWTHGRWIWMRTIGSTVLGEAADTLVFYPIAFYGFWPDQLLIQVMVSNYFLKVFWEVVATPLTLFVIRRLKSAEHEDYYDKDTQFTVFSLKD